MTIGLYLDVLFGACESACVQADAFPVLFHVSSRSVSPLKCSPKSIDLYVYGIDCPKINATLLSLINITASPGSRGAL